MSELSERISEEKRNLVKDFNMKVAFLKELYQILKRDYTLRLNVLDRLYSSNSGNTEVIGNLPPTPVEVIEPLGQSSPPDPNSEDQPDNLVDLPPKEREFLQVADQLGVPFTVATIMRSIVQLNLNISSQEVTQLCESLSAKGLLDVYEHQLDAGSSEMFYQSKHARIPIKLAVARRLATRNTRKSRR